MPLSTLGNECDSKTSQKYSLGNRVTQRKAASNLTVCALGSTPFAEGKDWWSIISQRGYSPKHGLVFPSVTIATGNPTDESRQDDNLYLEVNPQL